MNAYREISAPCPEGIAAGPISEDNVFEWEALIVGPEGTPYECGVFVSRLKFPTNYPLAPPKMVFTSDMWHPNVYRNGEVCISILHPHGRDAFGYEKPEERWTAVQSVEKILVSVMSMLAEPNDQSPANVDAAKMWRTDRPAFNEKVRRSVRKSLGLE